MPGSRFTSAVRSSARNACSMYLFAHETSWIMLTGCYLTLSQCCLRRRVMVDLRRIASERIKETPAVLEARTQSEGGTGLVRAIDRRHFAYHINAGISLPAVMFI